MPLTLVTGPANAGKARLVLDGLRERLANDPILVVPTIRDADEVAAIYSEYRRLVDRLGRADEELLAWRALEALAAAPESWGGTPVALYGFDDLTGLEREAVAVLSGPAGADVTVGLTWEDRVALAGRGHTLGALRPLAGRHVELPANAEYYAPASRATLHHLERRLFEPAANGAARRDAVGAARPEAAGGPPSPD